MHESTRDAINLTKEDALLNFAKLAVLWRIDAILVAVDEYDFLAPDRKDNKLGAVRFNTKKGFGADFAGNNFNAKDIAQFAAGFDKSDFAAVDSVSASSGFDIIGLCQKVYGIKSYMDGYKKLKEDLNFLSRQVGIIKADLDAAHKRQSELSAGKQKRIDYAKIALNHCVDYKDTIAETYLLYRAIHLTEHEQVIRFNQSMINMEVKKYMPAMVLIIQDRPLGDVRGIHRIFLKPDGLGKADLASPKMALGEANGNAIWFGEPCDTLAIAEGPENALTLRALGVKFVACGIFAGNIPNISIPKYVRNVNVYPDRDAAGVSAANKFKISHKTLQVSIILPTEKKLPNGKFADLNDLLVASANVR